MMRHGSSAARALFRRLASNKKLTSGDVLDGANPLTNTQRRWMSSSRIPEIPSFTSQLASRSGSVAAAIGLAGTALLLERWTEGSAKSGHEINLDHADHLDKSISKTVDQDSSNDDTEVVESPGDEEIASEDVVEAVGEDETAGTASAGAETSGPGFKEGKHFDQANEPDSPSVTEAGDEDKEEDSSGMQSADEEPRAQVSEAEPETAPSAVRAAEEAIPEPEGGENSDETGSDGEGGLSFVENVKATASEVIGKAAEAAGDLLGADEASTSKEEEDECPFCQFMKAGACREQFIKWDECVDDAEKQDENVVKHCVEQTHNLKLCMEANPDYYGPVLDAETSLEEESAKSTASEAPEGHGDAEAAMMETELKEEQKSEEDGQSGSSPESSSELPPTVPESAETLEETVSSSKGDEDAKN